MPPKILFYTSAIAAMLLLVFAIYNPFGKLQKTDNLDIAVVENPIPEKTDIIKDDHIAPVSAEEGSVAEQIIFKKDNEPANAGSADKEPPVLAQQNVVQVYAETSSLGPSFRDLAKVEQIVVTEKTPVINTSSIARFEIPERVEISQVFDDMLLRDEIREENAAQESKSVFGRILANIGNQIFGLDEIEGEKPSLLAGMLQDGKERFTEIAENSPLYEATQDDGSKGKYFAINENFSIRISKGDKNRTNSE